MSKYVKLGAKSTLFVDPAQPTESQRMVRVGEVKEVEETPRVVEAIERRGLMEATEAEFNAFTEAQSAAAQHTPAEGVPAQADAEAMLGNLEERARALKKTEDEFANGMEKLNAGLSQLDAAQKQLAEREAAVAAREAELAGGAGSATNPNTQTGKPATGGK